MADVKCVEEEYNELNDRRASKFVVPWKAEKWGVRGGGGGMRRSKVGIIREEGSIKPQCDEYLCDYDDFTSLSSTFRLLSPQSETTLTSKKNKTTTSRYPYYMLPFRFHHVSGVPFLYHQCQQTQTMSPPFSHV